MEDLAPAPVVGVPEDARARLIGPTMSEPDRDKNARRRNIQ
jgi:hypothetical protein